MPWVGKKLQQFFIESVQYELERRRTCDRRDGKPLTELWRQTPQRKTSHLWRQACNLIVLYIIVI